MTKTNPPTNNNVRNKKASDKPRGKAHAHRKALRNHSQAIEFKFQAPNATSVKLAADFTGWAQAPLEMTKSDEGTWTASVSLLPGEYAYRFIVDGEWSDDPLSSYTRPNAYGTANSVKRVRSQ